MGAEVVIAVDLGSHMNRRFPLDAQEPSKRDLSGAGCSTFSVRRSAREPPPPSIVDTLLGAIDVMQERIAQARLVSEPPEVLLTPRLGRLGPFEYHRAAMAIAEGRAIVAENLPAIREALEG